MCQFAHRKVSLRIFSRTSHGPRPTYSRKASADTSCTRRRIFHIRGSSVGSYCAINVPQAVEIQDRPTTDEGIPSTNINRLSFLIDSSTSSSTCRTTSLMPPGGNPVDKLHQAFFMGTTAKHEGVRKAWADSLVYSKKSAAGWTDVNLQELSRALVFRAIDSYEGPFDPLLDFILVLRLYFHDPCSKMNRLVNILEHEVANIFSFTWKVSVFYSIALGC